MQETPETARRTWRDNWFVRNVIAEIPVIGGFFRTANRRHALHHIAKSGCMLFGGTTFMYFNLLNIKMDESPGVKYGKMTAVMTIGMTGGVIIYNTLHTIGQKLCVRPTEDTSQASSINADEQPLLKPTP